MFSCISILLLYYIKSYCLSTVIHVSAIHVHNSMWAVYNIIIWDGNHYFFEQSIIKIVEMRFYSEEVSGYDATIC